MKIKERLQKLYANRNLFIAVCVSLLTILSLGISYSAFFTVKSNSNNQTVATGNLRVSYSGSYFEEVSLSTNDILPLPDREGMLQSKSRIIYVDNLVAAEDNPSTLSTEYFLTIGYDIVNYQKERQEETDKLTPIELIRFAVYDYDAKSQQSTLIMGPLSIADLPIYYLYTEDYRNNRYLILHDTISNSPSDHTKTYQVKVWLSDQATPSASNTYFYVDSAIEAGVLGAEKNYTLKGKVLKADDTVATDAEISFQNGYVQVDAEGGFTVNNIPGGTYNVNIKVGKESYNGNLTIQAGDSLRLTPINSFPAVSSGSIYNYAYANGTTIGQIVQANDLTYPLSDLTFNDATYNLSATYSLTSNQSEISNLTFKLTDAGGFTLTI